MLTNLANGRRRLKTLTVCFGALISASRGTAQGPSTTSVLPAAAYTFLADSGLPATPSCVGLDQNCNGAPTMCSWNSTS